MINDPIYNRLRELSWQRKLTGNEEAELQAWLSGHPEARTDWETEARLNTALGRLPDAPVASNFTARVLQAIEREAAAQARPAGGWTWLRLRWMPRTAFAATVVGAGLLSYLLIQDAERKRLAESVAVFSDVSSLPSPEILQDFDAIRASDPAAGWDEQLLTVLK